MALAITDVTAVKRPNSPIGTGDYWNNLFTRAFARVKAITGRALESASYDEWGDTRTVERDDGTIVYVYDLQEPTGTAIAYASFTTITIDGTTIAQADVEIEAARLIFHTSGHVHVAYPGGYLAGTVPAAVIKAAVCRGMEILHQREAYAGASEGGTNLPSEKVAWQPVEEMLWPYTQTHFATSSPHGPDDV